MNDQIRSMGLGLFLLFLFSCGSESREIPKTPLASKSTAAPKDHPGKLIYFQFCMACHMEKGEGVPGLYPPLIQTEMVLGDKSKLIDIVINGMEGPIEVNGEKYNNIMAKLDYLQDQQIADVLSYIRSNFGNDAGEVTLADVQVVRNAGVAKKN